MNPFGGKTVPRKVSGSASPQRLPTHPAGRGRPGPIIRHHRSNQWRDDGSSSSTSVKVSIRRAVFASRLFPAAARNSAAVKSRRVISIPDIVASHGGRPWIHIFQRLGIPQSQISAPSRRLRAIAERGRSRGGPTTKIHALTDACLRAGAFILGPGNAADISVVPALPDKMPPPPRLLADKGYDANSLRERMAASKTEAVIPSTRS